MLKKIVPIISLGLLLTAAAFSSGNAQNISPDDEAEAMDYYIRGVSAFENEDYQEALDYLNIAYLKIPGSSGVNYAMADAYLALQDYPNAEYYAQIAIDLEPENIWYHKKLVEIYVESRQNNMALETLNNAREHFPGDTEILFQLAALYAEFRDFESSNEVYDKILSARGSDFEIHRHKYRNYIQLDNPDAAIEELMMMRKLEPDNLNTIHTLSQLYMELNDTASAQQVLLEAKERNARNPETLILLADIYIKEAKWDSLGNTFVSIIEDPLFSASQKMELARFLYLKHQSLPNQPILTEQTERVLESFSRNEPDFGDAHLLTAEFYLNKNEISSAIKKLELVNRVMPEESEAWRQRLRLMFSEGLYNEVIDAGTEAVEHVQDDAVIHFFVGSAYMLTNLHTDAADWLEEAILMPSRSNFRSVIYNTLGDVLVELDRWEDAVESYEKALQLDSSNHNAMNNYAYFMSVREEQLEYAEELALRAIDYEPENAAYLDTAGWIYFKKGEFEKAKEYIKNSIETGHASAEVYEHLGDVYEQLGQLSDAVSWWEKALESDPNRTYLEERLDQ